MGKLISLTDDRKRPTLLIEIDNFSSFEVRNHFVSLFYYLEKFVLISVDLFS